MEPCSHPNADEVVIERRKRFRMVETPVASWCPDCGALRMRRVDGRYWSWSEWSLARQGQADSLELVRAVQDLCADEVSGNSYGRDDMPDAGADLRCLDPEDLLKRVRALGHV